MGHRVAPDNLLRDVQEPDAGAGSKSGTVDTCWMTMTFYDKAGRETPVEQISECCVFGHAPLVRLPSSHCLLPKRVPRQVCPLPSRGAQGRLF